MTPVMRPAVAASASPARPAGDEPRKERVKLGYPILWNVDGDLLVVGVGWS
jgi:hypothetical protein